MSFRSGLKWQALLLLSATVVIGTAIYVVSLQGAEKHFATQSSQNLEEGPLGVSISSTGQVNARSTVAVGSQVSGEISTVDTDFNQGQIIARIDPARYEAQLSSANAALLGVFGFHAAVLARQ
jgi:HlyD family secretion protein